MNNNEIIDESWVGQHVTCIINSTDNEDVYITDAKISANNGYNYGICQNEVSGADDGDHLGYLHVWRMDDSVSNLKLVKPELKFNFMDIVVSEDTGLYYVIASDTNSIGQCIGYSIKNNEYVTINTNTLRLSSFEEACKFSPTHALIKSVEKSIRLFHFGERKKPSLGKHLEFIKYSSHLSAAVVLRYPDVNVHDNWCISDVTLTIVLPVIFPQKFIKDLTVKVDDTVRLINNKKLPFERNAKCQVIKITTSVNNKYTIKNTTNSPLDVVYLKNLRTGRIEPTYMKNVKKITS
tara:strand:+ start:2220 stop:3098 length:879 start_codon:yes stop_codon:yes gene_type:complete